MRRTVQFFNLLMVMLFAVALEAHPVSYVVEAEGETVGAVCVDDTHLKLKTGKVFECPYDCFELKGGATCRSEPCEYVICNQDPWASCSNPDGPEPGILYVTGGAGVCDNTGKVTGTPGECYYPEAYINCGAPYKCVFVGHGHDYCIYTPQKKGK